MHHVRRPDILVKATEPGLHISDNVPILTTGSAEPRAYCRSSETLGRSPLAASGRPSPLDLITGFQPGPYER